MRTPPPADRPPLVSVVIPTRGRPSLVLRAAQSALNQSYAALEVVVILDGPDPQTLSSLASIHDNRLRFFELPQHVGGGGARNEGVRRALGEWIAFLDDDDEWMPDKLSRQMPQLLASSHSCPVATCRMVRRDASGAALVPLRRPRPSEPLSEYLLCRRGLRWGEGAVCTPTLVAPRQLLLRTPFREGLPRHQDWDWLLRASASEGFGLVWLWEPQAIYNADRGRLRIGSSNDWRQSLAWAESAPITDRAFAYFVAFVVCKSLRPFAERRELSRLLRELSARRVLSLRVLLLGAIVLGASSLARLRQRLHGSR